MANMNLKLLVWRQAGPRHAGSMVPYDGQRYLPGHVLPRDARRRQRRADQEGRAAHQLRFRLPRGHLRHVQPRGERHARTGPIAGSTVCQLHMRKFKDGDTITIEPWRAAAFPVQKDLVVDRGAARPAHRVGRLRVGRRPAARLTATRSRSRGTSPNWPWTPPPASGAAPASRRARTRRRRSSSAPRCRTSPCCPRDIRSARAACAPWSTLMDDLGFGNCSNEAECEAVCPKEISIANIARMRREYLRSVVRGGDS